MDKTSLLKIQGLHPELRLLATDTVTDCEQALQGRAKPRLTYGLRTFKEQGGLYALGRTVINPDGKSARKPLGNIVTNADAGRSIHNYGLAVDICLIIDGKTASWDTVKDFDSDAVSDWKECVAIFKKRGWEWGGDWRTFKDEPHFQYDLGYTWQQLQAKYNTGDFIAGTKFVNLQRPATLAPYNFRTLASVNMRAGADVSHKVLTVVLKGETVTELSRAGTWSRVSYNGIIGFISNQYLTK